MFNFQQKKLRKLIFPLQRYSGAIFFSAGFLFDIVTLDRLDDKFSLITQVCYLLASYLLFFLSFYAPELTHKRHQKIFSFLMKHKDDAYHFFVGSLLSTYSLYYFKSSSLSHSYFFLFIIFALLILNEWKHFQNLGPWIKSSLLKLCFMSFCIAYLPIMIGKSGLLSFLCALAVAFVWTLLLAKALRRMHVPAEQIKRELFVPKIAVWSLFLLLYLFKVIPPIPLAIKHAGVYHNIVKENDQYQLFHQRAWWRFWQNGDQHFIAQPGDILHIYLRIFAPGGLDQKIYVHYQKYFSEKGWTDTDRIPINVTGGREQGFRARTRKQNYSPGEWRVMFKTANGLEIGNLHFDIILTSKKAPTDKQRNWQVDHD